MKNGVNTDKIDLDGKVTKDIIKKDGEYLNRIISKLECSYYTGNCSAYKNNPTQDNIEKIINNLFKVIFPDFISNNKPFKKDLFKKRIEIILIDLWKRLDDQLFKSYVNAYLPSYNIRTIKKETLEFKEIARKITLELLEIIPEIRHNIYQDIDAAYRGDPAAFSYDEIILSYPFVQAMTVHNIAYFLYKNKVPLIPRMMSEWAHTKTGIDIHPGAQIGKSFFIDHGTGVVIGETAQIGNNVKLYQGVTIGALSFEKKENGDLIKGEKRHPTIEDNVIIYANATILGGRTTIGKNSIIGSNVWINNSVEENTIVTIDLIKLVKKNIKTVCAAIKRT